MGPSPPTINYKIASRSRQCSNLGSVGNPMCSNTWHRSLRNSRGVYLARVSDSCHNRCTEINKIYNLIPLTAVVKLLQYSGSRVEHKDEFSSSK